MPVTTQSNLRVLEASLGKKKRPENITAGGIAHVLLDVVVMGGGETVNSVIELSNSIPINSRIDYAASTINNAAMAGVSAKVTGLLADGVTVVNHFAAASIAAAGAKPFNANGGSAVVQDPRLFLTITAGVAVLNDIVTVRIVYFVR